jgi:hypothetical protein
VDSLWTELPGREWAACFAPSCVHCTAGAQRCERVFYYTPPRVAGARGAARGAGARDGAAGRGAGRGAGHGARGVAPGTGPHPPYYPLAEY